MTAPALFDYSGHQVRIIDIDGEPWFVAADVCGVLGIVNVGNALSRLHEDDIRAADVVDSIGRLNPSTRVVNESGLHDLVLDSRKPEAKAFRRWITSEVVPAIRRDGSYSVNRRSALSNRELALMVIAEADRADLAERKVLELAPAAEKFNQWQSSPDTVYIVEWAKTIGLTQPEAFKALREEGVLFKQRTNGGSGPAFPVPKRGWEQYFDVIDEYLQGPKRWVKVPKITPEGQVVLAELLIERGWVAP